jgi:DNA-binding PadR family transcriptional regulator
MALAADRRLNATAASLLGFLHRGPMSGWDLVATAEQVIGDFWSLTRSQVYRELTWMADAGLIEAGERGSRDRRPYRLTPSGRAAFAAWAAEPPGAETIRFPLLLKISFGAHVPPGRLPGFVREHRQIHSARLAEYEAAAAGAVDADPFAKATLAFGIAYERAVLSWFDSLPRAVRGARASSEGEGGGKGERRR